MGQRQPPASLRSISLRYTPRDMPLCDSQGQEWIATAWEGGL